MHYLVESLFIVATKICAISPAISKSRDIASRASTSSAGEGSGISVVCSFALVPYRYRELGHRRGAGFRLRYFLLFSHVRNADVAPLSRWAK